MTDDRLRLIFTCCHPALAPDRAGRPHAAAARRPGDTGDRPGLPGAGADDGAADRARETQDRGRRASPTGSPARPSCPDRLPPVLAVVYLIFNEGYDASSGGADWSARTSALEAIRLARELLVELMPDEPEVAGLLALLLLTESRRGRPGPHRTARSCCCRRPGPVALGPGRLIDEGQAIGAALPATQPPGPYQIQAAISAVHTDAPTAADTDWSQILALYDQLHRDRADAGGRAEPRGRRRRGARARGRRSSRSSTASTSPATTPFHATRADLLRRLGRPAEARGGVPSRRWTWPPTRPSAPSCSGRLDGSAAAR